MPFGAHETMEVHETLNEQIQLINHFALYAGMTGDAELRDMLERHLRMAFAAYDRLVAYTHDYSAAAGGPLRYAAPDARPGDIRYGLDNPGQLGPEYRGRFDDAHIAMAMLQAHKHSSRTQLNGALECADPNVREMLMSGAVSCANQAYEVFMFMNRRGMYQVPVLEDRTAKAFLHTYQPMSEMMYS